MLIKSIKADQLMARKNRETLKAALLTTLIGEAETAAKTGKTLEDADVLALIRKFIKNAEESMKVAPSTDTVTELSILKAYLPTQYTPEELQTLLQSLKSGGVTSLGEAMKVLKTSHAGLYDGAEASRIARVVFS